VWVVCNVVFAVVFMGALCVAQAVGVRCCGGHAYCALPAYLWVFAESVSLFLGVVSMPFVLSTISVVLPPPRRARVAR
jgi:hypothetical protein